jgi:hypothetical protein
MVPRAELESRTSSLYRNLGEWIGDPRDDAVQAEYEEWGRRRFSQGIPLSGIVYALPSSSISSASTSGTTDLSSSRRTQSFRPSSFRSTCTYIAMNEAHEGMLQTMRQGVRDNTRVATCLEFGPRFLH